MPFLKCCGDLTKIHMAVIHILGRSVQCPKHESSVKLYITRLGSARQDILPTGR